VPPAVETLPKPLREYRNLAHPGNEIRTALEFGEPDAATTFHAVRALKDNNAERVAPEDMLSELRVDNQELTRNLRSTHELCEKHNDVATASLIENWIDETQRRTWFLSEIVAER